MVNVNQINWKQIIFQKNNKGEHQKTCDSCLTKNRVHRQKQTKPVEQLVDEDIEPFIIDNKTTIVFDVEHSGSKEKEILQLIKDMVI